MKISESEFLDAKNLVARAKRVVIISHKNPDGDTVGANLAIRLALHHQGNCDVISACVDKPPPSGDFLPEHNSFVQDFDLAWPDLLISVDCGAHYMMKFRESKPTLLSGSPPLLNIDHHASNDRFGKINLVDDSAAAACQIVYRFLKFCGFTITRQIATCLLHGLYYDTGSFMHSNVTPEVLEIASDLLWKGADARTIGKKQFHTMPIPQLKVYGKILERARINSKKIAVSALSNKDFEDIGATPDDTTGSIDYLNSIPDGNFCCLVYEDKKGQIKGSFRSRVDHINLSRLAGIFGGGGHRKAAGFSLPGSLREIDTRIKIESVIASPKGETI